MADLKYSLKWAIGLLSCRSSVSSTPYHIMDEDRQRQSAGCSPLVAQAGTHPAGKAPALQAGILVGVLAVQFGSPIRITLRMMTSEWGNMP